MLVTSQEDKEVIKVDTATKVIGFIGLGNMGRPMAKNLLKAGYDLVVYDLIEEAVTDLMGLGAKRGTSPKDVAERSEIVITMLPSSPHVEQVILGPLGVLAGARPGLLVIDMSSIAPVVSQKVAAKVKEKGVRMLDAPVTGGTAGAANGTLTIMVGGDKEDLAEAMPIFEHLGKKVIHVGKSGMGQTAKVCNQIVVGISFCAVAEALVLGVKAGADPVLLREILNSGSAHCWALDQRIPHVLEGDFEPGFMINLQHKDLGLALDTGKDLNVPLPFAGLAFQAYSAARAEGLGEKDHSAVIQVLEKLVNVETRKGGEL
ncbi:MAG: NAD(P)-dependent oxidoreductase [bacterium]